MEIYVANSTISTFSTTDAWGLKKLNFERKVDILFYLKLLKLEMDF